MDVEGFERKVLRGVRKTLHLFTPGWGFAPTIFPTTSKCCKSSFSILTRAIALYPMLQGRNIWCGKKNRSRKREKRKS